MEESERRELTNGTCAIIEQRLAEIMIADTGPGIASKLADRLFQPFVTTKTTSMGLGLSICREIVEAHYGKLNTTSAPSVFRITLLIAGRKETTDVA